MLRPEMRWDVIREKAHGFGREREIIFDGRPVS